MRTGRDPETSGPVYILATWEKVGWLQVRILTHLGQVYIPTDTQGDSDDILDFGNQNFWCLSGLVVQSIKDQVVPLVLLKLVNFLVQLENTMIKKLIKVQTSVIPWSMASILSLRLAMSKSVSAL